MKWILVLLLVIMSIGSADASWWNTSFLNSVNGSYYDGGINYVGTLNVTNASGKSNSTHLYFNGKCAQVNCSDARLVHDNTTEEPYWVFTNATSTEWGIWYVNYTHTGGNKQWYLNYSAITKYNNTAGMINTFPLGLDFNTNESINVFEDFVNQGNWNIRNGRLSANGTLASEAHYQYPNSNFVAEWDMRREAAANTNMYGISLRSDNSPSDGADTQAFFNVRDGYAYRWYSDGDVWVASVGLSADITNNTIYHNKVIANGATESWYAGTVYPAPYIGGSTGIDQLSGDYVNFQADNIASFDNLRMYPYNPTTVTPIWITAYSIDLDSMASYPQTIFKCQLSKIYANFTLTNIESVTMLLTNKYRPNIAVESLEMVDLGSGIWYYEYGNDNTTEGGNKTLTFNAYIYGSPTVFSSGHIFVYPDDCVGDSIVGWRNITMMTGNYTKKLQSGDDLFTWIQRPLLEYWGYIIYLIVIFLISGAIYMKNQSIAQPFLISMISLALLTASNLIPPEWRNYMILLMAGIMAAMAWKVFK